MEILEQHEILVSDTFFRTSVEVPITDKKKLAEASLKNKKFQLYFKRGFDILVSVFLIAIFSPLIILTSILVKLTSPGPIFYSNVRIGYKGKYFRCKKFRSMVSKQEVCKDFEIARENSEKGILYKSKNDSRVTWIGKIIRRTSIDELPQLFNVLTGDMSIIGPRPLVPFMLKNLPEFTEIRCLMRPGITGLWQIKDRKNNTSATFMIEHDLNYVEHYDLLLDFKILMHTPIAVLKGDGAY